MWPTVPSVETTKKDSDWLIKAVNYWSGELDNWQRLLVGPDVTTEEWLYFWSTEEMVNEMWYEINWRSITWEDLKYVYYTA